jgi:hypothetical protein
MPLAATLSVVSSFSVFGGLLFSEATFKQG